MFGRKKTSQPLGEAALLAELREAALRAIWRRSQDGGRGDVNPHTAQVTTYALASMLTFSADGSPADQSLEHLAQKISEGKPEARKDWTVWELERLGHHAAAERLAELVAASGDQLRRHRWIHSPVMSWKARRLSRATGIDREEAWDRIRASRDPLQTALYVRALQRQRQQHDRS